VPGYGLPVPGTSDAMLLPRVGGELRLKPRRRRRPVLVSVGRRWRPRLPWRVLVAVLCAVGLLVGLAVVDRKLLRRSVPLYALGVAVHADGRVDDLRPGESLIPGSRVVQEGPRAAERAAQQRSWLASGRLPAIPELAGSDLVETALLDLRVLTDAHRVTVAGWTPAWRYVWPRDSAFVASAFARTGHLAEAQALLDFLSQVQPSDGIFQARYRPDGGVPDARGKQLDGSGWVLWGLGEVVAQQSEPSERRRLVRRYRGLLERSVAAIATSTGNGEYLPPASSDYWETPERRVTLASCGPLLAGLRHAAALYAALGDEVAARNAQTMADRFERVVLGAFGPDGFPRRIGGSGFTVDLGVGFLLPPFAGVTDSGVQAAWREAPRYLRRPAGGLAPGGSWRRDGISWTPTTATWAMTASCLDRPQAVRRLRWLDQHRTATGALPEKVLADGSPAAVAPLAWTAAAVVLAVDGLERRC
jgi:glucoamylase